MHVNLTVSIIMNVDNYMCVCVCDNSSSRRRQSAQIRYHGSEAGLPHNAGAGSLLPRTSAYVVMLRVCGGNCVGVCGARGCVWAGRGPRGEGRGWFPNEPSHQQCPPTRIVSPFLARRRHDPVWDGVKQTIIRTLTLVLALPEPEPEPEPQPKP